MKRIFKGLLLVLMLAAALFVTACSTTKAESEKPATYTITDMAGREVVIPSDVKTVYSTSPIGTIFMYTLNDKMVAGLNYKLSDAEKKYSTEYYQKLPLLGGWFGKGNTGNVEEIIKAAPDVIITMGDITDTYKKQAEDLQKQLGIPVLMVNGDLEKLDLAYDFMGKVTGEEKRAKQLGDYCKKTIDKIKSQTSKIPMDKRVSVYYAEGPKGLNTDPMGSIHTQVLDLVGGVNVANVQVKSHFGQVDVSMEQVLKWNPDLIIVGADAGFDTNALPKIMSDSSWKELNAVKNDKIYQIPYSPFNWFDRPPAVSRVLGAEWLGNLLYPDYHKVDIKQETKDFYKLFYHITIDDSDIEGILNNALAK